MSGTPKADKLREELRKVVSADSELVGIPVVGVRAIIDDLADAESALAAANSRIDRLDCTQREGGITKHCRVEQPCLRCQLDAANKRADAAEDDAAMWKDAYYGSAPSGAKILCQKCGGSTEVEFQCATMQLKA